MSTCGSSYLDLLCDLTKVTENPYSQQTRSVDGCYKIRPMIHDTVSLAIKRDGKLRLNGSFPEDEWLSNDSEIPNCDLDDSVQRKC